MHRVGPEMIQTSEMVRRFDKIQQARQFKADARAANSKCRWTILNSL